jgi:hypothetical protein
MGADFLTSISIPRLALERLIRFRKGRLNEVAAQHFCERLSEFFRRYAYDEWYALTREELAEYQKHHPDAAPFPWQSDNNISDDKKGTEKAVGVAASEGAIKERFKDYEAKVEKALDEWQAVISAIDKENDNAFTSFRQYQSRIKQIESSIGLGKVIERRKIALLTASDFNLVSTRVEDLLPTFEKATQVLDEILSIYISITKLESNQEVEELRDSLQILLSSIKTARKKGIEFRDSILSFKKQNVINELKEAAIRYTQTLNDMISIIEEIESLVLKVAFQIDERFGNPPVSEDKTD